MKKRIFAMFILAASMAMVACSSSSTKNEGATNGDNQALQTLEKKREFYKAQDREKAKLEVNDLAMVFPHQANLRIIESAAKRMKFPLEKFYMNLSRYGNTSSASVGIALGEAIEKGLVKKGDNIALTGFGGGLTYGSAIIKWAF